MSFTETLIEQVKRHRMLFDFRHPDYKNCRKKTKVWDDIGKNLNEDGEDLKKKWKNIRDCYQKHLRSVKEEQRQPGKRSYKNWQWSQQMEFCRAYLNITPFEARTQEGENSDELSLMLGTKSPSFAIKEELSDGKIEMSYSHNYLSNDVEASEDSIKQEIDETECSINYGQHSHEIKIQKNENSSAKSYISTLPGDQIVGYLKSKRKCIDAQDATDLIFLGYANTIKSFSRKRQATVKLRIAQIIMEEEIQHIEETTDPAASSTNNVDSTSPSQSSNIVP